MNTRKIKADKGVPSWIRTWRRFYWLVVFVLVVLIALFYWFTIHFG